jgi:hypothetical protein
MHEWGAQRTLETIAAVAVVTQSALLPAGGRLLFAGTEAGTVAAYRLPLGPSSEPQALRCSSSPVTRLAASRDEATLFAATADGCLFVFDVRDRDAARLLT